MMSGKRFLTALLLLVFLYLLFPPSVYAYLDPGTGSYIFQLLLAGLLGLLFAVKIYWGKIKLLVQRVFSRDQAEGAGQGENEDA
jgi:hypothetical protein